MINCGQLKSFLIVLYSMLELNHIIYILQTNGDLNESELDSENGSDKDVDDVNREKLDPADRELYEKMKRQEREERMEIERELKRAHEEALVRRRHEELRAKESLRLHAERRHSEERGEDLRINKHHDDYRSLRESHLLKSDSDPRLDLLNQAYLERYRNNHSPMSATSISPTNVDGPSHHWTFEEQFKQVC